MWLYSIIIKYSQSKIQTNTKLKEIPTNQMKTEKRTKQRHLAITTALPINTRKSYILHSTKSQVNHISKESTSDNLFYWLFIYMKNDKICYRWKLRSTIYCRKTFFSAEHIHVLCIASWNKNSSYILRTDTKEILE